MARNQRNQPPPKLKISLTCESPKKKESGFSILATAFVILEKKAEEGRDVRFYQSGNAIGEVVQTDENGRAQCLIENIPLSLKEVSIEAQVAGESARTRRVVSLPAEEKSQADEYNAELVEVDDGKYQLVVSVVDQKGRPVSGVLIQAFLKGKGMLVNQKTNSDGTLSPLPEIQVEENTELTVFLTGTKFAPFRMNISGPPTWKKAPKIPEPTSQKLSGCGFFGALIKGWGEGREEIKKRREAS